MKANFDYRYTLVEPFKSSDGKILICALTEKNATEIVFDPFESTKQDGNDHLRMMIASKTWITPNDFRKLMDENGQYVHPIEADIPKLIEEVSSEIEKSSGRICSS